MSTLLDPEQRSAIVQRLRRITPEHRGRWGKLDAPRMLCHVTDSLRVAVGDLPTRPVGNLASRTLIRWIVIHSPLKPPPGKVSTAPEMLTSAPTNWSDDLAAAVGLIERVGKGEATATHPSFGRLSRSEWCKLSWKHLDHHLRQFGE